MWIKERIKRSFLAVAKHTPPFGSEYQTCNQKEVWQVFADSSEVCSFAELISNVKKKILVDFWMVAKVCPPLQIGYRECDEKVKIKLTRFLLHR